MANITVVGVGGVGAQALLELSKTSHRITAIDRDIVEESTIGRQDLYTQQDLGRSKAKAAEDKLGLTGINTHLSEDNADELLGGADVVLDGTDNWQTRCVINAWAIKHQKSWIFTSAIRDETMSATITPQTPCFVCWNPKPKTPRSCRVEGIQKETTTVAAKTQTQELERLLKDTPQLTGTLQYTNTASKTCATQPLHKNPNCPACVKHTFQLPKTDAFVLCGDNEYLFETGKAFTKDALASLDPKAFGDVFKIKYGGAEAIAFPTGRLLVRGKSKHQAHEISEIVKQKQES